MLLNQERYASRDAPRRDMPSRHTRELTRRGSGAACLGASAREMSDDVDIPTSARRSPRLWMHPLSARPRGVGSVILMRLGLDEEALDELSTAAVPP